MKTLTNPERLKRHSVARGAAEGRDFAALPNPLFQRTALMGIARMKYTTG
jgi:hypothetical protein